MRNRLSILAGVLLAASVFSQDVEESEFYSISDVFEDTDVIASVEENKSSETVEIAESPKLDTSTVQFVKTEYVIDMPKENNGFSGGVGVGVYAFDMSPVRRLISARQKEESLNETSNTLRISEYDFLSKVDKREAVPTIRTIFYGINETKFHIGGVLEVGGRTWQLSNDLKDSVVTMGFVVAKAGVFMEQVLVHNDKNYLALGATLGGGGSGVGFFSRKGTKTFWENDDKTRGDWKHDDDDDDDDGIFGKKMLGAASGFVYFDVDLAYILSITKRFHLRFDAMCDIMGSKNGYNLAGDDYGIVNAGGAFSVVWGSKQ